MTTLVRPSKDLKFKPGPSPKVSEHMSGFRSRSGRE